MVKGVEDIDLLGNTELYDTVEGLNELSSLIALKYWGMDLDIPIKINNRLTRTYGRYIYRYIRNKKGKVVGYEPDRIEVSGESFNNFTRLSMLDLLKHELCHWACMSMGKSSSDGTVFFESELRRIGSTSTGQDMV